MANLMIISILLATYTTLCLASTFNKPGPLNVLFNQTATGTYTVYGRTVGNAIIPAIRFPSVWYQDDGNKRLKTSVGIRGQGVWEAEFFFFKNMTYELTRKPNHPPFNEECIKLPDFNYSMEIEGYNETFVSFVHKAMLFEETENATVNVYAGQALDGVGPLNILEYIDIVTGLFAKLVIVGAIDSQHYGEFYYDKRNTSVPDSHYFDLPDSCNATYVIEKNFFDMFYLNGTRKVAPTPPRPSPTGPPPTGRLGGNCTGGSGASMLQLSVLMVAFSFLISYFVM